MSTPSQTRSIVKLTCPRCRKGPLFLEPFSMKTAYKMHKKCPDCSQNFEPEPGYYYGAMFISYVLTGWLFLSVGLTLVFVFDWGMGGTLFVVVMLAILVHTFFFRLSRSIWIHLFIKYNPNVGRPKEE